MRRVLAVVVIIALSACGGKPPAAPPEKTYPMTATIVSRDPAQNTVNLDNKEVPGVMEAMQMDYELRGAKVGSLPPDRTPVDAKLHEQDGKYWVTDVKRIK